MDPNPYQAPHYHQEPIPQHAPLEIDVSRPLSVEFDLTVADHVAFNVSHLARGRFPTWTRKILEVIGFVSVPLGVTSYLLAVWSGRIQPTPEIEQVMSLVLFALLYLVIYPIVMWWALAFLRRPESGHALLRYYLKRKLSVGDTSSIFGHYKLTLSAETLHEQGPKNETSFKLSAVQKLVSTGQYLFIYVSPLQAYIVPRRAFPFPDDFEVFVRTVEEWTRIKRVE